MKTHQSIMMVTLSCLLLLISACGKKLVSSVSEVEDLFSSEDTHEVASHDVSGKLEETSPGDGWDTGGVEALSATDLADGQGETSLGGGGEEGSSGGAFGMGNRKGMSPILTRNQFAASNPSSGTSAAHKDAQRKGAHVSQSLRDVFFTYNSWRLSEQSHRILESNAEWLKAHPHARITIEGHCDERGTRAYNYVLGDRRAETAKQYLSHLGVPSRQIEVASFGKDRPVCHVFSAACFQSNRRAHFSMDLNTASHD